MLLISILLSWVKKKKDPLFLKIFLKIFENIKNKLTSFHHQGSKIILRYYPNLKTYRMTLLGLPFIYQFRLIY